MADSYANSIYQAALDKLAAERAAIIAANQNPAPKTEWGGLTDTTREALGLNRRYLTLALAEAQHELLH